MKIDNIPAEVRWEIAAKSATALPVVYDMIFRRALGPKYDEIELPIWIEGGKEVKKIADALHLPVKNAKEISDAYGIVSKILFGPELQWKKMAEGDFKVVGRVTGCPLLNRALEMGVYPGVLLNACQAYSRSAVENMNPRYTHRHTRRMCTGDPYCEATIELRK
jgi:hypothetical protein